LIDTFLKNSDEISEGKLFSVRKLDYTYLRKYMETTKEKDVKDKIAHVISDIKTYNAFVELMLAKRGVKENTPIHISNAKLIQNNLIVIRNILFG